MEFKAFKLNKEAQKKVVDYCVKIIEGHRTLNELRTKMEAIDKAYARYQGGDTEAGQQPCDATADLFAKDNVVAPIVISQVDSYVAYLSEVFLSGSPIFPIVSSPTQMKYAEQLETLIDDHAMLGGYSRQLLKFLRDGIKYNICALEADWDSLEEFNIVNSYLAEGGKKIDSSDRFYTRIRSMDMYNTIWDTSVAPGDVAAEGDFAGYVERLSNTKFTRLLHKLKKQGDVYNVPDALTMSQVPAGSKFYVRPQVSDYTSPSVRSDEYWENHFEPGKRKSYGGSSVEMTTMYLRIIPADFGIIAPAKNQMQIWQMRILNGSLLISARRVLSAYGRLPILFGQPLEDGMDYQTQSIAEMQIPIQTAATTMFNVRFSAARRAVSDRALYDPTMVDTKDVNSKTAAPKIPVRINPLAKNSIRDAYHPIPFDMRGTETAFQDVASLVEFSKQLSGVNAPRQGQFQRGNKSVQEWQDTMGGSDGRMRLTALCLEHQVFIWLKFMLVLNIYQFGDNAKVVSQRTGETLDIDITELRRHVLSFKVADGYTPKSKLASTEMLTTGMTLLMNSPVLQQSYGPMLPNMYAHMMSLGGVKNLDQYSPDSQTQQKQMQQQGLMAPPAGGGLPPEGMPPEGGMGAGGQNLLPPII